MGRGQPHLPPNLATSAETRVVRSVQTGSIRSSWTVMPAGLHERPKREGRIEIAAHHSDPARLMTRIGPSKASFASAIFPARFPLRPPRHIGRPA